MLKYIKEFCKYVMISGFRDVDIENVEDFLKEMRNTEESGVEVQFFNADFVASWQHLYFAVLNALTAFKNGGNISKSIAMETMLYASARRQIGRAMSLVGITPDIKSIATLIVAENPQAAKSALSTVSKHLGTSNDDTVLTLSEGKIEAIKTAFGISDLELETATRKGCLEEALVELVIERMALLTTQR